MRTPRLIALLSLPLFAAGCDRPLSDATVRMSAPGLYDNELWLVPFTDLMIDLDGADPELADWTVETDSTLVLDDAPSLFEGNLLVRVHSGDVGDGELSVLDDEGALVTTVPVHVRRTDGMYLTATVDGLEGARYVPGSSVPVLENEVTRMSVTYHLQDRGLGGSNQLVASTATGLGYSVDHGEIDAVEISALDEPYDLTLEAGAATISLRVEPVALADATLELVSNENRLPAGATASVRPRLRQKNGDMVFASPGRWTRDGAPLLAFYAYWYTYQPTATASDVEVTFGGPGGLRATTTVHVREP